MNLRKLIVLNKLAGASGGTLVENEETGNPVVFSTNVAKPLVSVIIPLTYSQSGSGDPSPSNVRPITGTSSVSVDHNNSTYDVEFPEGAVAYGGSLDLVSGVLTLDWAYKLYTGASDEVWKTESISAGRNFYIATPSEWKRDTTSITLACNLAKPAGTLASGVSKISKSGNLNVCIGSIIDASTVEEFKTWLASNNMQIAVKLNNPITVQLTPQQITAIVGTNTIEADVTGNLTVTYITKE